MVLAALSSALSGLSRLAPAALGQTRGMARAKTAIKAAWQGWPNFAPDGWEYGRSIKRRLRPKGKWRRVWQKLPKLERLAICETKQQKNRRLGHVKGKLATELFHATNAGPAFERID